MMGPVNGKFVSWREGRKLCSNMSIYLADVKRPSIWVRIPAPSRLTQPHIYIAGHMSAYCFFIDVFLVESGGWAGRTAI